jgi:hypothetical protein
MIKIINPCFVGVPRYHIVKLSHYHISFKTAPSCKDTGSYTYREPY